MIGSTEAGFELPKLKTHKVHGSRGAKMASTGTYWWLGYFWGLLRVTPSNTAAVPVYLLGSTPMFERVQSQGDLCWVSQLTRRVRLRWQKLVLSLPPCGPDPPLTPPISIPSPFRCWPPKPLLLADSAIVPSGHPFPAEV